MLLFQSSAATIHLNIVFLVVIMKKWKWIKHMKKKIKKETICAIFI